MANLDERLEKLGEEEKDLLEKINQRNSKKSIQCNCCKNAHSIADLTAIQTHWYTEPFGCTDGDYWSEGELQFICPDTGIINRMLFNNYNIPYEGRRRFENDPEAQFKRNYKGLFKEVVDSYEKNTAGKWVNNFYVDQNRKKFGLVEKKK